MIYLYDVSAARNALVAGTSNRTELLTGYFTMHGDGACALEPIGHLYKTEVRQLANYLKIPQRIIDKAPSAGLWEGQTDEDEMGIAYSELDIILCLTSTKNNDKLNEFMSVLTTQDKQKTKRIMKMIEKNKFKLLPPEILKG
jgi:NAD+ synthase